MVLGWVGVLWVRLYGFQACVDNEFRDKPARAKSNSLIEVHSCHIFRYCPFSKKYAKVIHMVTYD